MITRPRYRRSRPPDYVPPLPPTRVQAVHVLSAAYSPEAPDAPGGRRQSAVLGPLFMMMGRALERIASVPAGNVLAIAGVSGFRCPDLKS